MACAQQSATEYLRNARRNLVTDIKNFPLIIENLYQQNVFNDHEVDALKAERTEFDKARCVLDWVINKGEMASYEFLKILDVTKKRTLDPVLHYWISCFSFRVEDTEATYSFGTKPCQIYQAQLKMKAKSILKNQRECFRKYLDDKAQVNFSFIPLVLKTDSVMKTQCKIKLKNKKCKKLRPKKLRAYIPNVEQALPPDDLLKWQDKNILIIGKPGVGKTTVVQEMLHLWSEKDDRELDYMFYFDESVLAHSSSAANLKSILFDVYLKPMDKDKTDVFQDIEENSENVVIVFDGVTDLEENSIFWKIMNHELLPDAKIVITCRSEVEDDPLFSIWPTRKVYVQGFSEESINTYYQSMLGHDPLLLGIILKNPELFSLSHVPLYAFMIVDLIKFKNDTECTHPHTVTEMYIHIFRLAVKKHGNKKNKHIDKYLKEIKDQVHPLMENAFNATMRKRLNLSDISSDETDICHAFLKMITTKDSPTSATTYCAFLHNTMQEFFSALWLLHYPDEIDEVLQLCQTEEHKHMRHVLPFLCGFLSKHNIRLLNCLFPEDQIKKTSDWLIEKLLDTFLQPQSDSEEFDLLYVCQCLYELQSPKACLMFLEKMDHQLEPEVDLDPHQCCALSYVISQSRDKEVYLNLEDCNVIDVGMNMMLSCSPNIRLKTCEEPLKQIKFFLEFFHKTSQCCCRFFDDRERYNTEQCNALLDLYSHVKNYETQTGRSFLPALQSVFQSAPDVWIIDLSQRKTSILLEVLKLQTEKKLVELRGCSEEESEMMSFLQCLPFVSQMRFWSIDENETRMSAVTFLLNLCVAAVDNDTNTGTRFSTLLSSVCSYETFPFPEWDDYNAVDKSDFLLDLYSHVKNYETQAGRSFVPALQSVFQSAPDVWAIFLSEIKTSILLEVLKLQTEKKPVDLLDCPEEESDVMSFLHCLPYISQLRFWSIDENETRMSAVKFLLNLCVAAVENDTNTGTRFSTLLSSVCSYEIFPFAEGDQYYTGVQSDFLLDLYSHVKNYETQTGRSFLPALQSVFQLPDVWIIDLSQRKSSVLLEVLKLQTEKKPVELRGCSEEESEIMSFLQCLSYISQLGFWFIDENETRMSAVKFLLNLCVAAVENDTNTGTRFSNLLSSVCSYETFPFPEWDDDYNFVDKSAFLLDLCLHVKNYETQAGRSFVPALQSVFQSAPDVWAIFLSEIKTSILLEVLKLQTEKKPVDLLDCPEEESDVMSFLHCLPYISQLRFWFIDEKETRMFAVKLLLNLYIAAVENDTDTGTRFLTLLSSVCSYETFPFPGWVDYNAVDQSDFLLGLYSHVKNYETQTGRSFLPALQSVFQLPDVWIIDLSERESSILQEVLKLQTEKKPVELRGCSEEESEMMSFLQCMPYISQLSCSERCLLTLVKVVQFRENPELVTLLLEVTGFSVCLEDLSSKTCESVGGVLHFLSDRLNLTLKPKVISVRETRLLFRHITNIHTLRLSGYMVVRIVQALRSMRVQTPITVNELKLDLKLEQWSETKLSRVLSSLAILLRLWTVQCLNLTEYKIQSVSVFVLLCHQGPLTLRPSKETLQKLVECVYEAQEEELTQCLLQKVGGDLTSCSLNWEELHYFLQHRIQQITLNLRKSNIKCSIREILPFLNRIKFKWMSSSFMLSIIREIYESGSVGFVSSLLSSVENYINLQSRELDSVHCAALRFTLQHCTAVSLNLQWTSIPEEELESILPLFKHVSHLSVDRLLLLKMLHCCSVSDVQQEAAAVLLSILQHKLDFSCCSALDLTTNTDSEPLHLTTEDCRVTSRVIQRAHSDTKTQLILQDCEITTAGMNQLFPVLHSLQLCCDKSLLLQFLAHVRCEEAESLSQALGEDLNLSQTQLDLQVCRGLKLILEYSEGLTELDLSQCRLTDDSLDLLLPNLHKAQNIDFSDNSITDAGAQKIYSVVTHNSNIKTVRLFNNRIESKGLFLKNPLFEIW